MFAGLLHGGPGGGGTPLQSPPRFSPSTPLLSPPPSARPAVTQDPPPVPSAGPDSDASALAKPKAKPPAKKRRAVDSDDGDEGSLRGDDVEATSPHPSVPHPMDVHSPRTSVPEEGPGPGV